MYISQASSSPVLALLALSYKKCGKMPYEEHLNNNNYKVTQNTNMYIVSFPSVECYKTVFVIIIIIINLNFDFFFIIFKR